MRGEAQIIQESVSLEQSAAELDALLGRIREGEAAVATANRMIDDWRVKAGRLLAEVRKGIPERGRNAKAWGEFVAARGISLDTAANYMKLAEYAAAQPDAVLAGKTVAEVYETLGIKKSKAAPSFAAPAAAPLLGAPSAPHPVQSDRDAIALSYMTPDIWETFCRNGLSLDESQGRRAALTLLFGGEAGMEEQREKELAIVRPWRELAKKAKKAGQPEPPMPPPPAHYLRGPAAPPAAAAPPVAASPAAPPRPAAPRPAPVPPTPAPAPVIQASPAAALAEAERLGRADAGDSAPRTQAELLKAIRAAVGEPGKDQGAALAKAYMTAREQEQARQREQKARERTTYPGLFSGSPLAGRPLAGARAVHEERDPVHEERASVHEDRGFVHDERDVIIGRLQAQLAQVTAERDSALAEVAALRRQLAQQQQGDEAAAPGDLRVVRDIE